MKPGVFLLSGANSIFLFEVHKNRPLDRFLHHSERKMEILVVFFLFDVALIQTIFTIKIIQ